MDWLSFGECTAKTVMSVRRPKMKRDAGVKCCLFNSKKTAFHSSVSLHFWATNGRYGFRVKLELSDFKLKKTLFQEIFLFCISISDVNPFEIDNYFFVVQNTDAAINQ